MFLKVILGGEISRVCAVQTCVVIVPGIVRLAAVVFVQMLC